MGLYIICILNFISSFLLFSHKIRGPFWIGNKTTHLSQTVLEAVKYQIWSWLSEVVRLFAFGNRVEFFLVFQMIHFSSWSTRLLHLVCVSFVLSFLLGCQVWGLMRRLRLQAAGWAAPAVPWPWALRWECWAACGRGSPTGPGPISAEACGQ